MTVVGSAASSEAHPADAPFLCHRIYDLGKLGAAGARLPATPIAVGLREHVDSLQEAA